MKVDKYHPLLRSSVSGNSSKIVKINKLHRAINVQNIQKLDLGRFKNLHQFSFKYMYERNSLKPIFDIDLNWHVLI